MEEYYGGRKIQRQRIMKAKHVTEAVELENIPNIGKALADDLRSIGITRPAQLRGKDGMHLYKKLNTTTGMHHDPCVADTFLAAVDFMNGGRPKPWWAFTAKRKKIWQGIRKLATHG